MYTEPLAPRTLRPVLQSRYLSPLVREVGTPDQCAGLPCLDYNLSDVYRECAGVVRGDGRGGWCVLFWEVDERGLGEEGDGEGGGVVALLEGVEA